ncbi:MAG: TolC family protein [Thermoanaerobaculia bacterium]|nr:TolC family protein [Thermoanaerobaculia bacterium]
MTLIAVAEPIVAHATETATSASSPAWRIVGAVDDPPLRDVLEQVLQRNPELQAMRSRIEAWRSRPDQVGSLPDPMLHSTVFALPPETRVGPQRLQLGLSQRIPSKVRRQLRRDEASLTVRAAEANMQATELRLVTQARELWLELAFFDTLHDILRDERGHLERHEEAARARYAAGTGLAQGPIKIQAQLTRIDTEILDIDARRQGLRARLDAVRDWPSDPEAMPDAGKRFSLSSVDATLTDLDLERLRSTALIRIALHTRPEMEAANARRDQAQLGQELAESNRRPEFNFGLSWTLVEGRQDDVGRSQPPEDDGRDVLAFTGGMTLPLWRTARRAELTEALARIDAAGADARREAAEIRRQTSDLAHRLPFEIRQLELLRDVLERQAEEAVTSVVSAYSTGQTGALDLLDAEHRLFEVRRDVARARADVAIALARLEGALATPLAELRLENAAHERSSATQPASDTLGSAEVKTGW